ncbi:hypothetical protein ACQ4PT_032202 [Festuca glaucescens]
MICNGRGRHGNYRPNNRGDYRGIGRDYDRGGKNFPLRDDPPRPMLPPPPEHRPVENEIGGYQEQGGLVGCILGGSQAPLSHRHFKQITHGVAAVALGGCPMKLQWSSQRLSFDEDDHPRSARTAGSIPLLCTPTINNVDIKRTLIDGGAGLNVISIDTYEKMQLPLELLMPTRPFRGVTDGATTPLGQLRLPVTLGTRVNFHTEYLTFDVAHIGLPYNTIPGYPPLAKFMAVPHHAYNLLKMSGPTETITIPGDEIEALRTVKSIYKDAAAAYLPNEDLVDFTGGVGQNGGGGPPLRRDMPGVPREVIEHHLAMCPNARPVKQKARRQVPEKKQFIIQEVEKLRKAGFLWEVTHTTWLANPVVAAKGATDGRLCVDYTNVNKIKMAKEDEEKTTFLTPNGVYCYTCIPFGLKNAGATFQRLMHKALGEQMGKNAEAYVDDIVVKTRQGDTLIQDLQETFNNL